MDSKDRWPHKLRSSPLPAEMVRTQQSRSLSVAGLLTRRCRFLLAAQPLRPASRCYGLQLGGAGERVALEICAAQSEAEFAG